MPPRIGVPGIEGVGAEPPGARGRLGRAETALFLDSFGAEDLVGIESVRWAPVDRSWPIRSRCVRSSRSHVGCLSSSWEESLDPTHSQASLTPSELRASPMRGAPITKPTLSLQRDHASRPPPATAHHDQRAEVDATFRRVARLSLDVLRIAILFSARPAAGGEQEPAVFRGKLAGTFDL